MALALTPEKALIFRITHISNVQWLLSNGVHSQNSRHVDPNFVRIGSADLISKRATRAVPVGPGGCLADYVPFYFTPSSIMLMNIITGYHDVPHVPRSEIVILIASLRKLMEAGFPAIFTDQHAYPVTARYFSAPDKLDQVDWDLLQRRDFKRDPDDPNKKERYQAEALVYGHLPKEQLAGIACHGANEERTLKQLVREAEVATKIVKRPSWYF